MTVQSSQHICDVHQICSAYLMHNATIHSLGETRSAVTLELRGTGTGFSTSRGDVLFQSFTDAPVVAILRPDFDAAMLVSCRL